METATFGGGCFWCIESAYNQLNGVHSALSGYMGGKIKNPSYREVCNGTTGHAEVVQIQFDSEIISFETLLNVFWTIHDPTTLNRQGADVGTQYRSVVFYHSEEQKEQTERSIQNTATPLWQQPIVTEVSPATTFYVAEDYHQAYFQLHGNEPYCQIVVAPKIAKFRAKFSAALKK